MADALLNKLGRTFNAATQHLSNEIAKTTKEAATTSLQRVSNAIIDATAEPNAPRYYHSDLDHGRKGDILRPVALGYKAGAQLAHIYQQGAKFVFGRGQRSQSFAFNSPAKDGHFAPDGYQREVAFEHAGHKLENTDAQSQRSAAIYKNNVRALKQEGILGLAVKATAAGIGNIIGAAFCGNHETAEILSHRIGEGAHVFNAGMRSLLLGVPMAAAVLAGVIIGAGGAAWVASWHGLRALYTHYQQRLSRPAAPGPRQDGDHASDAGDVGDEGAGVDAQPPSHRSAAGHVEDDAIEDVFYDAQSEFDAAPEDEASAGGRAPEAEVPAAHVPQAQALEPEAQATQAEQQATATQAEPPHETQVPRVEQQAEPVQTAHLPHAHAQVLEPEAKAQRASAPQAEPVQDQQATQAKQQATATQAEPVQEPQATQAEQQATATQAEPVQEPQATQAEQQATATQAEPVQETQDAPMNAAPAAQAAVAPASTEPNKPPRVRPRIETPARALKIMDDALVVLKPYHTRGTPAVEADIGRWNQALSVETLKAISDAIGRITYSAYQQLSTPEKQTFEAIKAYLGSVAS